MAGFDAMDNLVWVRATVNLSGLSLGREALVNPDDPYIAECLAVGYLQRLAEAPPAADETEPVVEEPPEPSEAVPADD